MLLRELISELRNNILHDRSDRIADSTSDYLWTDETLVTYIDEAQIRLAAEGFVIRDGSNALVTEVTLAEGQTIYPLHPSVIAVMSARYDTDVHDLGRAGHSIFNQARTQEQWTWEATLATMVAPGRPSAYSTDEQVSADVDDDTQMIVNLRVYPPPSAAEVGKKLYLRVARLPLDKLDLDYADVQSPEVPRIHHLPMLDWAAYLALRIVDTDGGNPSRAADFEKRFEVYVKKARKHALRKMFAPVAWNFGRAGWGWER